VVSVNDSTSCLAWAYVFPSNRVMKKRKELMAIGSYAVCSVIALQSDDLISVRGHMTPASLIQTYIVGPIKKKPNKLNLKTRENKKKHKTTHQCQLSFVFSQVCCPPQTLHPVVGAECPFLDKSLFDEAAARPESSIR